MPRKPSSQWEFGELFEEDTKESRHVLSVSQLTTNVRKLLEKQIGATWVSGEISNLRVQSSGHAYFSLKDDKAQLSCVLFRGVSIPGRSALDNGLQVILQGDVTVYEPRGQYQLIVRQLEFQGAGALQIAFEKLKRKLDEAGYFAPERKRPLPRYPQRIGIVTSPTGAALRDVLHVIERRFPALKIIIAPCRVQGQGAATEIADRIQQLNEWSTRRSTGEERLDLILTTRGGGSLEDLWAFNEEVVANAIHQSALPVVSAIGHEIDFTISDFVADFRAATPSAAAEIITEGVYASLEFTETATETLRWLVRRGLESRAEDYNELVRRLGRSRPLRQVQDRMQRLDELNGAIQRTTLSALRDARQRFEFCVRSLNQVKPSETVRQSRVTVHERFQRLTALLQHRFAGKCARFDQSLAKLNVLSPDKTIERGFSMTTESETGKLVRDHRRLKPGQRITTRVKTGTFESEVRESDTTGKTVG